MAILLAPFIACVLDLVARLRRRRIAIGPGLVALGWRACAWLVTLAAMWLLAAAPGRLLSGIAVAPLPGRTGVDNDRHPDRRLRGAPVLAVRQPATAPAHPRGDGRRAHRGAGGRPARPGPVRPAPDRDQPVRADRRPARGEHLAVAAGRRPGRPPHAARRLPRRPDRPRRARVRALDGAGSRLGHAPGARCDDRERIPRPGGVGVSGARGGRRGPARGARRRPLRRSACPGERRRSARAAITRGMATGTDKGADAGPATAIDELAPEGSGPGRRRRATRRLGTTLMVLGVLVIAYAGVILVWGDPFTALYADWRQQGLSHTLNDEIADWPVEPAVAALRAAGAARRAPARARRAAGAAARRGRVRAQAEGRAAVRPPDHRPHRPQGGGRTGHGLAARPQPGAGPLLEHPLPRAGHDGRHRRPPHHLRRLVPAHQRHPQRRLDHPADAVRHLPLPGAVPPVVPNTDWKIIRPQGYERLVLSACHPLYSSSHRWIVFARGMSATIKGGLTVPLTS